MAAPSPPDRSASAPASMADHEPSSNRRRKEAQRAKRKRRAERAEQAPPPDERAEADKKLRAARRGSRNHLDAIRRMAAGECFDLPRLSYLTLVQEILHEARMLRAQSGALSLVHACLGTKLLADNPGAARERIRNAFVHLAVYQSVWIRSPADWRPARRDRRTQLSALIRHLLTEYPLPRLLDEAWTLPTQGQHYWKARRYQRWFLHLAAGGNLRTAPGLPVELTKRMAHHTLEADEGLGIGRAIRFGQARALGFSEGTATAFALTRAGDVIEAPGGEQDGAFWTSVLRFLAPHRMLDPECIGPIVDYLIDQRYVPVRQRDGAMRPVRPNLSMQGRTLEGLLERTATWHRQVVRNQKVRGHAWGPMGILVPQDARYGAPGVFTWRTGSTRRPVTWQLQELLTSKELAAEGRALGHCVFSYAWSCARGRSSIWSMRREHREVEEHRVTVEVQPSTRTIVQARGPRNRPPQPAEWAILERFARAGSLKLPERLRG